MSLYPNAIPDGRTKAMLPVTRIMVCEGCTGAETLVNNRNTQIYLWNKATTSLSMAPGGWILVDFGREISGGAALLCLHAGKIRLRFGESVSEAMNCPNQDHAMHDAELQLPAMSCFEYGTTAFRFLRIDSLETAKTLIFQNILASVVYLDLEWTGSFESSDERLNQIWKTSVYTVQLNMQQLIYDGCKRDRLPWLGDLNPEMRTILSAFSDTSLLKKTLDYCKEQTPPGNWVNGIPSYSLWFIICQWEYYQHTGDINYLKEQKEYIRCVLQECASMIGADGSENLVPSRFLDLSNIENPTAVHAGLQGLLYWAFQIGQKLFHLFGEDTTFCDTVLIRMKQCTPDCGGSKGAAAIQTISGLADRTSLLLQNPLQGMTTFLGCYILQALPTETALHVIKNYWGAMLDYGATTFWEEFNLDWVKNASPISELPVPGKTDLHANFGIQCFKGLRRSLCHGWSSGPASFLSWRLPGIRFLEPGGKKIAIHPVPCGPEYITGALPTVYGPIRYELENHQLTILELPEGITLEP